ncbi:MAG: protein-export chaperone SecB [Gammaproteobacteria bacterium]|nr:protein-export chaperone SecB [Gammaproteobacteria bacterium]
MAEESFPDPGAAPRAPQLAIERVYVRDVSFESPKSPGIFGTEWKPEVHMDINTRSNALDAQRHEVVLTLTIEARIDGEAAMIVELQQAGIFRLENMDAVLTEQVLATACPTALFPYARETVDALVTKGTFPPLMLAPMNFDALYAEAKRRAAEREERSPDSFVN